MISIFQLRSNYKDIDAVLFSLQNTMMLTRYITVYSHMIVSNETQIRIAVRTWLVTTSAITDGCFSATSIFKVSHANELLQWFSLNLFHVQT